MKTPKVVIAGHVCIDHNVTEHATYHSWGSPAMYIADYYRRRLNLPTTILTSYGPDFLTYTKHVTLIPAEPQQPGTLLYRNVIKPDLRTWYCEHAAFATPPPITDGMIHALQEADILIVATLLPNYPVEYVNQLLSYVEPTCITALCAQGYLRNITADSRVTVREFVEAEALIPAFDITILSDEDHPQATDLAHNWKALPGARNIILSQGAKGASILSDGQAQHIPTTPVPEDQIVDSVGCGDVFLGSLVHEYYFNRNLPAAITRAHLAARDKLLATNVDAEPE